MHNRTRCLLLVAVATACSPGKDERPTLDGVDDTSAAEASDTASTDAEETSGGGTTTTGSFVPDMPEVTESQCDPWAQDCPEGEKCVAYESAGNSWDANKCVPVMGEGVEGDECTYDGAVAGTDSCAVGHMCYYANAEGIGTCIPQCTGTGMVDASCPAGFNCSISNEGSMILCVYDCNPLLQDCAPAGTGCFWDGALFNCDPAGDITEGQPCGYINDCAPGQICLDAPALPNCAGSACCAAYCDLEDPVCQIAGTECVTFWDEGGPLPGFENVGICVKPA
jgi:hypothetical protein